MSTRRHFIATTIAAGLSPALQAQSWPSRPVKIIYNYAPGGTGDSLARYVAQQLSVLLGQQFVVDNRTGAQGAVGILAAARSPADGYTVLITTVTAMSQMPYMAKDAGFDPLKTLTPIGNMAVTPLVLLAHPSVPANDFPSLVEWVRKQPAGVNMGTAGPTLEMATAYLSKELKIKLVNVPYRGQAPALQAALSGEVQLFFNTASGTLAEYVRTGKLKLISVTTAEATPVVPGGVPINKFVPGFVQDINFAMWTPPGVPQEARTRLTEALAKVMAEPGMDERLLNLGMAKAAGGPDRVTKDIERQRDFIKSVMEYAPVKFGE